MFHSEIIMVRVPKGNNRRFMLLTDGFDKIFLKPALHSRREHLNPELLAYEVVLGALDKGVLGREARTPSKSLPRCIAIHFSEDMAVLYEK